MKQISGRHGDLCINYEPIPSSVKLEKVTAPIVLAGRDTAPHVVEDFEGLEYGVSGRYQYLRIPERARRLSHAGRHVAKELHPGELVIWGLSEMNGDMAQQVAD